MHLPSTRSRSGLASALLIAVSVAIANFGLWALLFAPSTAPDVPNYVSGLSYTPFQRVDDPIAGRFPPASSIKTDLAKVAQLTNRIRSYTSAQFPELPKIAAEHGLSLTAGIWLNGDAAHDAMEIRVGLAAAEKHSNISRLLVGNETVLKKTLTPKALIKQLDSARAQSKVPISTAEPWHVWLAEPELAEHVDFITIHLLPYWEGVDIQSAVPHALYQLESIKKRFPNKSILIGEVGWPSNGDRFGAAIASPANQAIFIREFIAKAGPANLDYFLMEAFDQPWKAAEEGRAGAYWGMGDAQRAPKFAMRGAIEKDPYWRLKATTSSAFGFALALFCLSFLHSLRPVGRWSLGMAIQILMAGAAAMITQPFTAYMHNMDWVALAIFVPTLVVMLAILLSHVFEFSELFWDGSLRRKFQAKSLLPGQAQPFVSIHLPCCNESPDMVIATICSLAKLDYQNFEVLVIDNNTKSEATWRPVEAFVKTLPDNFKFFHLPSWPGYKAGALNFALAQSHPTADIVGVVDADYLVKPNWLQSLVAFFDDDGVGVVQAPQAHREWGTQVFRTMMNWEYEGFFRIGMHHRNERNAIIQHGTMTLIKASALRNYGQWSEWCVCEDTELGLRLMQHGLSTIYVDEAMGHGLTPDSFAAFKKQRNRWAQGGMQILKAHADMLLGFGQHPNALDGTTKTLTKGQRYHFMAGWLPWIGDALHWLFAIAAVFWTLGVVFFPRWVTLPTMLFMLPLATFVLAKVVMGPLLYWARVPCTWKDIAGASVAGMGVSHGIARGVISGLFSGLIGSKPIFEVTDKGSHTTQTSVWRAAREEIVMLSSLLGAALLMTVAAFYTARGLKIDVLLWILMLVLQGLPYAAALLCVKLSQRPKRLVPAAPTLNPAPLS
jgi:exo-beta-1,3-glucanase (GH17 family)/cellulose synthase/poly-beta-1,6-N-acetylglucosamine synthase-like glycosyltransferase